MTLKETINGKPISNAVRSDKTGVVKSTDANSTLDICGLRKPGVMVKPLIGTLVQVPRLGS